jgi:flagellar hook-basal body complex protein FliE
MKSLLERPALLALGCGLGLFIFVAASLGRGHLQLQPGVGPALQVIWWLSLVLLFLGAIAAAWDVAWLRREWRALTEARQKAQGGITVLKEADWNSASLVSDRVRAVLAQSDSHSGRDIAASLRLDATSRTAAVGTVPRFVGSLLLLLSVLGTFAGMRTAVPLLVDALSAAATAGTTTPVRGMGDVGEALGPVADAFGANFLALLGSFAMGIVAFGAIAERRHFLRNLERVSGSLLYPLLPAGADATELQKAVEEMRRSVSSVADVGSSIRELHGSIRSFEGALVNAIDDLRTSFSNSLQRQSVTIQQQLTTTVGNVATAIDEVSTALSLTAASYEGLVKGLEERDLGLRNATEALKETGRQMARDLEHAAGGLVAASTAISQTSEAAAAETRSWREQALASEHEVAGAARLLADAGTRIATSLAGQERILANLPMRLDTLGESVEATRAGVSNLAEESRTVLQGQGEVRGVLETFQDDLRHGFEYVATKFEHLERMLEVLPGQYSETATSVDALRQEMQGSQRALVDGMETVQRALDSMPVPRAAAAVITAPVPSSGNGNHGSDRIVSEVHAVGRAVDALRTRLEASAAPGPITTPEAMMAAVSATSADMASLRLGLIALSEKVRSRLNSVRSYAGGQSDSA